MHTNDKRKNTKKKVIKVDIRYLMVHYFHYANISVKSVAMVNKDTKQQRIFGLKLQISW